MSTRVAAGGRGPVFVRPGVSETACGSSSSRRRHPPMCQQQVHWPTAAPAVGWAAQQPSEAARTAARGLPAKRYGVSDPASCARSHRWNHLVALFAGDVVVPRDLGNRPHWEFSKTSGISLLMGWLAFQGLLIEDNPMPHRGIDRYHRHRRTRSPVHASEGKNSVVLLGATSASAMTTWTPRA